MPNPAVRPDIADTGRVVLAGVFYDVIRHWGRLPTDIVAARVSQVAVDRLGRLHVLRRAATPVVVFAPDGEFLFSYGTGQVFDAHGIRIDALDRVLIADRDAHQILLFSSDGALLFALGERHVPSWERPFNHPTQATVAADGEIYVADGYGNARIHRFGADGGWLSSFGTIGTGNGEFTTPHAILVDRQDRLLVCDRENDRVQVFDRTGNWLQNWGGLSRPMDLFEQADGTILVSDQIPSLHAFAPDGHRIGRARPSLNGAHGLAVDRFGDLYLAEIDPSSVTKLIRI